MKTPLIFIKLLIVWIMVQTHVTAQTPTNRGADLTGTQWVLGSIGSLKNVAISVPITFDGDKAFGTDGCNRFIAAIEFGSGNELKFKAGNAAMTLMSCWDEAEAISQAFRKLLADTRSYTVTAAHTLQLKNEQGEVLAIYVKQNTGLAGTDWQIQGLNNGFMGVYSDAAVSKLSLSFHADGTWVATIDCESQKGQYQLGATRGAITMIADSGAQTKCKNSSDMNRAQLQFLSAIKRVVRFHREGDTLELRSRSGSLQILANLKK